jgi:hypothetical protein
MEPQHFLAPLLAVILFLLGNLEGVSHEDTSMFLRLAQSTVQLSIAIVRYRRFKLL